MGATRLCRDARPQPIRVARTANLLVPERRRRILSGDLVDGDLLPGERRATVTGGPTHSQVFGDA